VPVTTLNPPEAPTTADALAVAQNPASSSPPKHGARQIPSFDFGMTYTQERAKFAGEQCQCFPLRGATLDVAADIFHGLGVIASAQGVAVSNLNGSIDIHQITFLGGVRYVYNLGHNEALAWGRKGSVFIVGMGGYTFATSGLYPNSNDTALTDHASALTYMGGGGFNIHVYEKLDVRIIEVDYVRTDLPNGGTNQQNTLRAAAGLNFHFGH
jgi:hypothetical protein